MVEVNVVKDKTGPNRELHLCGWRTRTLVFMRVVSGGNSALDGFTGPFERVSDGLWQQNVTHNEL